MRVWVAADAAALRNLKDGSPLVAERVAAESEDEAHEHEAMLAAAEAGPVVVVAELDDDAELTVDLVQALHVDADGSGELAWYATQEIDEVVALLERS